MRVFDYVIVGAGSAGCGLAARLSEDPRVRVPLLEAGGPDTRPEIATPMAFPMLLKSSVDWDLLGEPEPGLGGRRLYMPRGKVVGGSSSINAMIYVRGNRADFDAWAAGGAEGWSYDDVLPYFKKSEGLVPSEAIPLDLDVHNTEGPLGVSVRSPVVPGAQAFVDATVAAGIPLGDYNGRDRGGPDGVVSLFQTTTRDGKRSSTFPAFLEGEPEQRPNLTVIPHAQVTRVLFSGEPGALRATGVEYATADGGTEVVEAGREVILCAGAVGSPQLLLLSGVGPREHLESLGIQVLADAPEVGRHLKDHLHLGLMFPAPGLGVSMAAMGVAMGPDALRAPAGPLPADPADDASLPPELQALKAEAERQLTEWFTTGHGLASSSLYDAAGWFSTGLGDEHTHDAQVAIFVCGYNPDIWNAVLSVDPAEYFDDPAVAVAPTAENIFVLANPVQPHSEGEIRLAAADPLAAPDIRMNYFADPHDLAVMTAVVRRTLDIIGKLRESHPIGDVLVAPALAAKHGHAPGDEFSDE